MTVVLGIVGGIGSGKSTVAGMFGERGAVVVDADAICTELHREPRIRSAIRERWGDGVFDADGSLNRSTLAGAVFDKPEAVAELNRIMHPHVVERVRKEIGEASDRGCGLCVIDAPLLLESGLAEACDATVFVACDPAERTRRLTEKRGWTPDEIGRREVHQLPLDHKRKVADFIVTNNGDLSETRKQVEHIADQYNPQGG